MQTKLYLGISDSNYSKLKEITLKAVRKGDGHTHTHTPFTRIIRLTANFPTETMEAIKTTEWHLHTERKKCQPRIQCLGKISFRTG